MAAGLVVGNMFLVAWIEALLLQIVNPSIHNNWPNPLPWPLTTTNQKLLNGLTREFELPVYPQQDGAFRFLDNLRESVKKIIGDHRASQAVAKDTRINFFIRDTVITMNNNTSRKRIGITFIEPVEPEWCAIAAVVKCADFIFSKRTASAVV